MDMLQTLRARDGLEYRVVAVDPLESRREKMADILVAISGGVKPDNVVVADIETAKRTVDEWTGSIGCNAVLEVCVRLLEDFSAGSRRRI